MSCRSDNLKTGRSMCTHRSLLKAWVLLMKKWVDQSSVLPTLSNEIIPGHVGLKNCGSRKRRHSQRRWCTNQSSIPSVFVTAWR